MRYFFLSVYMQNANKCIQDAIYFAENLGNEFYYFVMMIEGQLLIPMHRVPEGIYKQCCGFVRSFVRPFVTLNLVNTMDTKPICASW